MRHLWVDLRHGGQIWMYEVVLMVKTRGFTEKQVLYIALQFEVFDALKPNELDGVSSIGKGCG